MLLSVGLVNYTPSVHCINYHKSWLLGWAGAYSISPHENGHLPWSRRLTDNAHAKMYIGKDHPVCIMS